MGEPEMKKAIISVWALAVCGLLASTAMAQRGVGNDAGVARQAVRPEVVALTGKVVRVETGPCQNTTGRAFVGSHFLMETSDGQTLNIHLGPAGVVDFAAKELAPGKEVRVQAFRTEAMKEGHYTACKITCGDRTVTLRDETLRPAWAGGPQLGVARPAQADVASPPMGAGRGRGGHGRGYGRGNGRGYGRGYGNGWGRGQGGTGYGIATGQCPRFNAWNPAAETKADDK